MNHLAHAFLFGANPQHLVGNVVGDFIKGPLHALDLVAGIRQGVQQRRRIDAFGDSHLLLAELKAPFLAFFPELMAFAVADCSPAMATMIPPPAFTEGAL